MLVNVCIVQRNMKYCRRKNVERGVIGIDVDCSLERSSGRIDNVLLTSNEEKAT
jgi:hypothetical protein